ncbi:NUDIX hydrolase [Streptococcus minor]|uniref:NUDIX hydrolase n=1 Tax=Streptococcus minor TaxID=229549 RepID=UPI000363C62E|nr:NUDIX domain-containing protein [Streptococcus minor]
MDFRTQIANQVFGVRAVALIVQDGKIFLTKRGDSYHTIGGAVEVNESTNQAVVRETKEELGMDVEVIELAFVVENWFKVGEKKFHNIEFHYMVKPLEKTPNMMVEADCRFPCEWVSIDDLEHLDVRPDFLQREMKSWNGQLKHIINY